MVIGQVAYWMSKLKKGEAVVIDVDAMEDSARAYLDSRFDFVRREYIDNVAAEINSNQYPEFSISERIDDGRWCLIRKRF